jgi:hypothetical protein
LAIFLREQNKAKEESSDEEKSDDGIPF